MRSSEDDITTSDRHEPGFNARGGFGQKTRKKKMEVKEMVAYDSIKVVDIVDKEKIKSLSYMDRR